MAGCWSRDDEDSGGSAFFLCFLWVSSVRILDASGESGGEEEAAAPHPCCSSATEMGRRRRGLGRRRDDADGEAAGAWTALMGRRRVL